MKMKFLYLIVAVAVLAPCCWSWTDVTTSIMTSTPVDVTTFSSYTDYLFPDLSSSCQSITQTYSSMSGMSQAVTDWIVNVRQNYGPWCNEIMDIVNQGKADVTSQLQDAVTYFNGAGDELDWGVNMMNTILTAKGCDAQTISNFMSGFQNNGTVIVSQVSNWAGTISSMSQMIPQSAIYGFQQAYYMATGGYYYVSPLKALKQAEFQYLDDTTRLYRTSTDYTAWYMEAVLQGGLYSTRARLERLVDGGILAARALDCSIPV